MIALGDIFDVAMHQRSARQTQPAVAERFHRNCNSGFNSSPGAGREGSTSNRIEGGRGASQASQVSEFNGLSSVQTRQAHSSNSASGGASSSTQAYACNSKRYGTELHAHTVSRQTIVWTGFCGQKLLKQQTTLALEAVGAFLF